MYWLTTARVTPTSFASCSHTDSCAGRGQMPAALKASCANLPTVAMASTSAFVPLRLAAPEASPVTAAEVKTRLHARLPNGVEIDLSDADPGGLLPVLELLGRLPCSGSTTR